MKTELPRYRCHKIVQACKIGSIEFIGNGGAARITPEDTTLVPFTTNPQFDERYKAREDLGYFVLYQHGFESWSPSREFEEGYHDSNASPEIQGLTFGQALEAAKRGAKIAREGWNGEDMFVVVMPALRLPPFNTQEPGAKVNDRTAKHIGEDAPLDAQPYLAMYNAQGQWIVGWLASQSDILGEDWKIVE